MLFADRKEAGEKLADKVKKIFPSFINNKDVIVLALPRGGVPIGYEIAKKLNARLDLIVTHKLGAPGNEELAIGAVAEDSSSFIDPEFSYRVTDEYVKQEKKHQLAEIKKRIEKYREGRPLAELKNKIVILVDDGIATGNTMQAAIKMAKSKTASKIIIAVPVLPEDTLEKLKKECGNVIYIATPEPFFAIGRFYINFPQLTDEEVKKYLR